MRELKGGYNITKVSLHAGPCSGARWRPRDFSLRVESQEQYSGEIKESDRQAQGLPN